MLVIYLLMELNSISLKQKALKLSLENCVWEGFSDDTSLISYALGNGKIYHFSVGYQLAAIDKIQKNHKYLMQKHNI